MLERAQGVSGISAYYAPVATAGEEEAEVDRTVRREAEAAHAHLSLHPVSQRTTLR